MSDLGSIDGDLSEGDGSIARSPSVADPSAEERWRASEPPEEIFEDGAWKFQIIGEEVDHQGKILYEIEWEDWEREDHSNVTWETPESNIDIKATQWKSLQQQKRNELASRSLSLEVTQTTDIQMTATYLRKQALREKLKKYKRDRPPNRFQEMEQLMRKHQVNLDPDTNTRVQSSQSRSQGSSSSPFPLRTNQRASTRQQTESSLASRSTTSRASSRFSSESVSIPPNHFASSVSGSSSTAQLVAPSSISKSSQNLPYRYISSTVPLIPRFKGKEKETHGITSGSPPPNHLVHGRSSPIAHLSSSPMIVDSQNNEKGKRRSTHSESEDSMSTLAIAKTLRKRLRRIVQSASEDDGRHISPSRSSAFRSASPSNTEITLNVLDRRNELQLAWTTQAQKGNAAPIYFVNDVDDEEIPDIDNSFCYLESTYEFSSNVVKPPDDFLIFCTCRRCPKATLCECQQPSDLLDAQNLPIFAYKSGLFQFIVPGGTEVIECNKFCGCSKDPRNCPNRVSQKPRKHSIEVYKTKMCGWGVRSPQPVRRGQVLGIYTGLVIPREQANDLPEHLAKYRFDLDGDENGDQEAELNHPRYSVDSRLYGNWTRFINHSCSPNLQIYLVVHDTPPGVGLPYIVFVANQDIPAHKEFTFDYNPSKPLPSSQESEGDRCHCGSDNCRGFY